MPRRDVGSVFISKGLYPFFSYYIRKRGSLENMGTLILCFVRKFNFFRIIFFFFYLTHNGFEKQGAHIL